MGARHSAARFVAHTGRKKNYNDNDVRDYLKWASSKYPNQNSYLAECNRILGFLRRLPDADRQRILPIAMPKMAAELNQPIFSNEEIERLIWGCVVEDVDAQLVVRLMVSTIYGARIGELAPLSSNDIVSNGLDSSIRIKTEKNGQRKAQPLPIILVPLFDIDIEPMYLHSLRRGLQALCKKVGVSLEKGYGFHSIRRRVVTELCRVEHSETSISDFLRWAKPGGMLSRYRQIPAEETDRAILAKHPFVKVWEEVLPHLLAFNTSYLTNGPDCRVLIDNSNYQTSM